MARAAKTKRGARGKKKWWGPYCAEKKRVVFVVFFKNYYIKRVAGTRRGILPPYPPPLVAALDCATSDRTSVYSPRMNITCYVIGKDFLKKIYIDYPLSHYLTELLHPSPPKLRLIKNKAVDNLHLHG